jgi:hypothetical protein
VSDISAIVLSSALRVAINAMLLNEFLNEDHQVQDLKAIVAKQHSQIDRLTAALQKVSAQIEAGKPARQMALSNPQIVILQTLDEAVESAKKKN